MNNFINNEQICKKVKVFSNHSYKGRHYNIVQTFKRRQYNVQEVKVVKKIKDFGVDSQEKKKVLNQDQEKDRKNWYNSPKSVS